MHGLLLPVSQAFLCYHDLPGDEPACVWIHGLGAASSEYFPEVARHPVLAGQRAILVDLLGFGFSDRPEQFGYTIEDHADSVAVLLAAGIPVLMGPGAGHGMSADNLDGFAHTVAHALGRA